MNVRFLSAGADVVTTVLDLIETSGADISDTMVVFPGMRPRYFLFKALAERHGSAFFPPNVTTSAGLIDVLYKHQCAQERRDLDPLDAAAILHELHAAQPQRLGGRAFESFAQYYPLGMRTFGELEELMAAGADGDTLRRAAASAPLQELSVLAALFRPFYAAVATRGCSTPAMRLREVDALANSLRPPAGRLIYVLPPWLSQRERRILLRLLQFDSTVLLVQDGPGVNPLWESLGVAAPPTTRAPEPRVTIAEAPDMHAQVFGLAASLRSTLDEGAAADESTVIVLPNAQALFPVMQHVLPLAGETAWNISLGYPLARTPVHAFLTLLFDVLLSMRDGRCGATEYVRFMLHPYVKNIRSEAEGDTARMLCHTIEETLIDRGVDTVSPLLIENDDEILSAAVRMQRAGIPGSDARALRALLVEIHTATIRAFEHAATLSDFAAAVVRVLEYIGNRSTARVHRDFRPFAEQVMDAMWRVSHSDAASLAHGGMEDCVTLYQHVIAGMVHHFPGTPVRGLQVLGLSETRALRFRRVFILDAQDDVLPGGPGVPSLIPPHVRDSLGMRTERTREDEIAHIMHHLLAGAERVYFFYSTASGASRSRYVERLLWEQQRKDKVTRSDPYIAAIAPAVTLTNGLPSAIGKSPETLAVLSSSSFHATGLDRYLRCQRRFYFTDILGLRERAEISDDVEAQDIGILVHEILDAYHAPHVGLRLGPEHCDENGIEAIAREQFRTMIGDVTGGRVLLHDRILRRMREYVSGYLRPLVKQHDMRITQIETRLEGRIAGFRITGKPDRIDDRDGRVMILDYKTGGNAKRRTVDIESVDPDDRASWATAIGSLQLPLYHIMYAAAHSIDVTIVHPMYLSLNGRTIDANSEEPYCTDPGLLGEAHERLVRVLERLIREIINPGLPLLPPHETGVEPKSVCPYCPYVSLCGTEWITR
ncbi:MAG: PD-(D/E)XK nuclease family protein [Ignavibacteriae bacterium]|nr:PD-(D/E)XK nuclease family protein [Ignavibacteriota bacterium]